MSEYVEAEAFACEDGGVRVGVATAHNKPFAWPWGLCVDLTREAADGLAKSIAEQLRLMDKVKTAEQLFSRLQQWPSNMGTPIA